MRFRVFRNGYAVIRKEGKPSLEFETQEEALEAIKKDVEHQEEVNGMILLLIGVLNNGVMQNPPLEVRVYEYRTLYQEVYTILKIEDQS